MGSNPTASVRGANMEETLEQELKRLRKLVKLQDKLLSGYSEFSSAMPFSMSEMIDDYDEIIEKIEKLREP